MWWIWTLVSEFIDIVIDTWFLQDALEKLQEHKVDVINKRKLFWKVVFIGTVIGVALHYLFYNYL